METMFSKLVISFFLTELFFFEDTYGDKFYVILEGTVGIYVKRMGEQLNKD